MKALTFRIELPRLAFAKVFGALTPRAYVSGFGGVSCENVEEPKPHGDAYVMVKPALAGICGSDVMQVFLEAAADNPLSAVVSAPHVMGHEVVGTVVEVGKSVKAFKKDDRVAVSPWLSCSTRG
ncbi:MAG TPA: alcohol dehydrogenase catalytic domain-containing protein, partial [Polyangiaceae bacterium]